MFGAGLAIGIIVGFLFGFLVMAVLAAASRADDVMERD